MLLQAVIKGQKIITAGRIHTCGKGKGMGGGKVEIGCEAEDGGQSALGKRRRDRSIKILEQMRQPLLV